MAVARAAGVSTGCVSRGLVELEDDAESDDRVRRRGAGCPALAAKGPGLRAALLALVEDSTQGDPIGPLTWTTKSLRRLATELAAQGRTPGSESGLEKRGRWQHRNRFRPTQPGWRKCPR
ncbi:hypothetical protein ACGFYM_44030 [Streptomyces sp. NPDC048231]|uniref:ISAzo13-like element transposase-related protein n=1 Tax=unclassified Streptomyces TaxID=2593676 RepID=UPI003697FD3F